MLKISDVWKKIACNSLIYIENSAKVGCKLDAKSFTRSGSFGLVGTGIDVAVPIGTHFLTTFWQVANGVIFPITPLGEILGQLALGFRFALPKVQCSGIATCCLRKALS